MQMQDISKLWQAQNCGGIKLLWRYHNPPLFLAELASLNKVKALFHDFPVFKLQIIFNMCNNYYNTSILLF